MAKGRQRGGTGAVASSKRVKTPVDAQTQSVRPASSREVGLNGAAIWKTAAALPGNAGGIFADRRRARLLGVLAAMLIGLALVLALGARFLLSGPGMEASVLPPLALPGQQTPPRFVFAINGVSRPLGVGVSPAGDRVYVTESDGERQLKIFDHDGNLLRAVAPPETGPGGRAPVYVAAHPSGAVYVSDRTRGVIEVYSREGDYEGVLEPPAEIGKPWAPLGLAISPSGDIALTEVSGGHHRVIVLGTDGAFRLTFGQEGTGVGQFSYPNSLAFDSSGRILISDSNNGRVAVFDAQGQPLWAFGRGGTGGLGLPRGLVIDRDNRLYVADTVSHDVAGFTLAEREARQMFRFGAEGQGNGQFAFPNGIAVDQSGRLYIADRENHRVQVWTY